MNARIAQRGATLIFVLILLVAMLIGGVSLVRSVDTGLIIAGNLAFKRTTTHAGDMGIEQARTWLQGVTAADLENDNPVFGYYATRQTLVKDFSGMESTMVFCSSPIGARFSTCSLPVTLMPGGRSPVSSSL